MVTTYCVDDARRCEMARPRIYAQTPEQADRQSRFADAMRWAGMTWTSFSATHGFVSESIWRWVKAGDPSRAPRNSGKSHSSDEFGRALDIAPAYFRAGGPRLMVSSPVPYAARDLAVRGNS